MLDIRDIFSLTDFQRNAKEHLARLRETGRPAVLTVNGRSELVVQSAEAYQQLLDRLERAEVLVRGALESEPDRADFLDTLGWVLCKQGRTVEGVEVLEQAQGAAGGHIPEIAEHVERCPEFHVEH